MEGDKVKIKKDRPINSSVVIARLLASDGYNDYVANRIAHYWRRCTGLTPVEKEKVKKLEQQLSELVKQKKFTKAERKILGRFIGLHKKMCLETGLRIGLTCFAKTNQQEINE